MIKYRYQKLLRKLRGKRNRFTYTKGLIAFCMRYNSCPRFKTVGGFTLEEFNEIMMIGSGFSEDPFLPKSLETIGPRNTPLSTEELLIMKKNNEFPERKKKLLKKISQNYISLI